MQIEEQQLKSAPSYHTSLNLLTLPPTDISIVQSHVEDLYPLYSPKGQDTPVEFFIPPSSSHYLDLHNTQLYLRCKVKKGDAAVGLNSKTVPTNLPFASIFANLDIMVNNVAITSSSNNYPYAAYINRVLSNGLDAKDTRFQTELLCKPDKIDPIDEAGVMFSVMKNARNEFELIGRLAHGFFNQIRMLPPQTSIRLKLRRAPNTFSLCGSDPATGTSFKDLISIEEAVLKCKKAVIHRKVQEMHENALAKGNRLEYPYKDFDVLSYSIPSGTANHVSETIHMGAAPDAIVVGLVESKAYSGTPSKSPFAFKHFGLSSMSVLLDGEPQVFKEIKLNVDNKQVMHAYSQLFSLLPPNEGGNAITPKDFTENGLCLLVFDMNNAIRENRFALTKSGSLKLHCTFSAALTENIHVICYMVNSKLLEIDAQNNVFLQ